jgi:hypothetical protein
MQAGRQAGRISVMRSLYSLCGEEYLFRENTEDINGLRASSISQQVEHKESCALFFY